LFDTREAERFIQNAQSYVKVTNEKLPHGLSQDDVLDRMRANVSICRQLMLENNNFIDSCLKSFFSSPNSIDDEDALRLLDFARRLYNPIYSNEDERIKLDSFLALDIYKALVNKGEQDIELLIKCWFGIGDIYYLLSGSLYSPESVKATKKAMELAGKAGGYFALKDRNTRLCTAAC
jgi:hypothetical protein